MASKSYSLGWTAGLSFALMLLVAGQVKDPDCSIGYLDCSWFHSNRNCGSLSGAITVHNQCGYGLTVFAQNPNGRTPHNVPAGAYVNLGLPNPWTSGVIWGSRSGNTNNGQATQMEFNIGANGRDYYDISLVNAYNEPAMINPTYLANGDVRSGLECGTPSCTINNLNSVCTGGNYRAGPDNACINVDGPGTRNTGNIQKFRAACGQVYVQSNDNTNVVYACNTGSNYEVIFCP